MGLVVVDNFDIVRIWISPSEANSVLIVDSDAMLTASIALECLKPISRRNRQVFQESSGI